MLDSSDCILLTGGTGSFGQAMTQWLLNHTSATIRIYSRSELLQAQMAQAFQNDRVRYLLGDVRDRDRLETAMYGVDCVFHAAALKHVDKGQYDSLEFKKTNVDGTINVIHACHVMGVKRAVFLSSDKSVHSINLYGTTKKMGEELWTASNAYRPHGTVFSVVRYGNVLGSRGSLLHVWRHALQTGKRLRVTDFAMTRFHISLAEAVELAWFALHYAPRGSILVPYLPAYTLETFAHAVTGAAGVLWKDVPWQAIGIRPGEKRHETLLCEEEAATALTFTEDGMTPVYYGIPPVAPSWAPEPFEGWQQWPLGVPYRSDTWPYRLGVTELRQQLEEVPTC